MAPAPLNSLSTLSELFQSIRREMLSLSRFTVFSKSSVDGEGGVITNLSETMRNDNIAWIS